MLIAATLSCAGAEPRPESRPAKRPNFVFVYSDDHRWDAMSCMKHPFVQTPNMDRLAAEGLRFANAFVTTSLCAPSRASILTGQYAHTHGVRNNTGPDYGADCPTLGVSLQELGYETAYIGKWHMDSANATPRPGYDQWVSFPGQGVYIDPELNENGRTIQAEGYITDLLTDYAVSFIEKPHDAPFCLVVSHKAVHGPFEPADRHKGLYEGAALPEPPTNSDDLSTKPAWQRATVVRGIVELNVVRNKDTPVPPAVQPPPWRGSAPLIMSYHRTLVAVDDSVGRIYAALDRAGVLDDTVFVYSSDNGFRFFDRPTLGDKRLMYEASIRVPYLVRYPPLVEPGTVRPELVLNIDLAPTFIDLAGGEVPAAMQGRSWRPLLEGRPDGWRTSFLYEYFQEAWVPGLPTLLGVRTDDWKLCTTPDLDDIPELYDLANDPYEMINVAMDPAYAAKREELEAELERLKSDTGYRR